MPGFSILSGQTDLSHPRQETKIIAIFSGDAQKQIYLFFLLFFAALRYHKFYEKRSLCLYGMLMLVLGL